MSQNTHHLFYLFRKTHKARSANLFYPRSLVSFRRCGWITIVLLLFSASATAQEQTTTSEFHVGTPIHRLEDHPVLFEVFDTTGFNTIWQRADENTHSLFEDYNLLAANANSATEYINHYTTAYYSKWEAEQNQIDLSRVGVKHIGGQTAFWYDPELNDTVLCWSTKELTAPACSLMYGPHYRQDKRYKRWRYPNQCYNEPGCVTYTPRFRMALDNRWGAGHNEDVCIIKVVFRFRVSPYTTKYDTTFIQRTLKVADFDDTGKFDDYYLHPIQSLGFYDYSPEFILPKDLPQIPGTPSSVNYIDSESYTGIQFWVDWLRTDTLCTLYIDYAEVYDNDGWNNFIDQPIQTVNKIINYADSFKTMGWDNIIYWSGVDEPYSIDCYTPIRVVDELIRSVGAPPLVVHFDPAWWYDIDINGAIKINGEDEIAVFDSIANPSKIILGIYPCAPSPTVIRPYDFEWLRFNFQRTSVHDSSFWFKPQTFGYWSNNDWCVWRKPKTPELNSMVMLSLAHGAKGIIFEWFDSYPYGGYPSCPNAYIECLVSSEGVPEINEGDNLYSTVKDNIVPRLRGTLGNKLLSLNYTGDYLQLRRHLQEEPGFGFTNTVPTLTERYLTLTEYAGESTPPPVHFHAGFLSRPSHPLDNYFMLDNLIPTMERTADITIEPPISGYENYRFRNVEGLFDTTFNENGIEKLITYPPGEGYLYQVAPVVLYGGRLIYPEPAGEGQVLIDDMIIESGATLTIYDNYNADANITVKNGTILVGENGRINFGEGKKLIIEGTCNISGTSTDKLELVFSESQNDDQTGIEIKVGGTLTINNCKIENANIGINLLVNANYLNVQNVDFINCSDIAINIAGYNSSQILTPPIPSIKYCTVTGSEKGIWATNLSQIIIRENYVTGAELGIYLSNVTTPAVIGNQLNGTRQSSGIFLESCNGVVRGNWITNHTNAIHIGNSSPDIGGNTIFRNWNRGLYVGAGSLPNLRGKLVQDPEHPNLFYAVSGYNRIYENGGWEPDDDGSEIFINNANAIIGDMRTDGCNEITDQRIPNTEAAPPLYNTQLLMKCESWSPLQIEVHAEGNFWDEHPLYPLSERFEECIVYYEPILNGSCPQPDGSEGKLPITSVSGESIDTLYAEEGAIGQLTETELLYANAEGNFLTADFGNAMQIYVGIINSNATEEEKYFAYQRKYEIGKLLDESPEFFNEMNNSFLSLTSVAVDTLAKIRLNQLATLSKVGEEEYETAITEFDNIVQQNPNTEEAVYAEIDALTTALLLEETDSTLQKGRLGKYLIKSSANYHQRVDEILRKHFGSESKETEKELLPTEFTLYQNYPNPFNPTTTIKYDLPITSDVSLIIYDILGRKVKELVNTNQQAGRYEVQFNASNLASGVYIYQLIAEKYMQSRKMILLR